MTRYTIIGWVEGTGWIQHVVKAIDADRAKIKYRKAYSGRKVENLLCKRA